MADHLDLKKTHLTEKKPGCVWRHTKSFEDSRWPECSHRKNAWDYAKANEKRIFDIPNSRVTLREIELVTGSAFFPTHGGWPGTKRKIASAENGGWHLEHGYNFTMSASIPYWHNAHHLIACGEVQDALDPSEIAIVVAGQWNINAPVNVMILPKQPEVAGLLKLPTHVPPDGKQSHDAYSEQVADGVRKIKDNVQEYKDKQGHPKEQSYKLAFDSVSNQLRALLVKAGWLEAGVNLDTVSLERINWAKP